MSLVLDASQTMACCFVDEITDSARELLRRVGRDGARVPALWHLEVANALQIAARRGRCTVEFVDWTLARLALLPISVDDRTAEQAWGGTLAIARSEGLTLYDAAYLELAMRLALPLATRDARLVAAAERRSVEVLNG